MIISVVIFEIFLRYSPFSSGISPVVYDKDIGMWHKKDFSGYLIKECYKNKYTFDEIGRVANSYTYEKNKKDIVLLGDSQIEALMVENSKNIHNSLYKELDDRYNVLNYGLSGTGPSQQYQILKNKVELSNVDTIIHFVFLENDLNDTDPKNFASTNRPKVYMKFEDLDNYKVIKPRAYGIKEKIRDFLGNFELYAYLKKTIYYYKYLFEKQDKNNIKIKKEVFQLQNEEYKWTQLQGSVYQINKLTKKLNIKYKIVIYSTYEFKDNYSLKTERFEKFLTSQSISHINLVPFLKDLSKTQSLSFECDGHWNGDTHEKISSFMIRKMLGNI